MIRPLAFAAAFTLIAAPAFADKLDSGFDFGPTTDDTPTDTGPAGPDAVIAEGYAACVKILSNGETGFAETEADGWVLSSGPEPAGTFLVSYYSSKDIPDAGLLELYVMMESYPSVTLGYCRLDVTAPFRDIDVGAVGEVTGYEGNVQTTDTDTSGVWQDSTDNPRAMIMANQYLGGGGAFFMQMTTLAVPVADGTM